MEFVIRKSFLCARACRLATPKPRKQSSQVSLAESIDFHFSWISRKFSGCSTRPYNDEKIFLQKQHLKKTPTSSFVIIDIGHKLHQVIVAMGTNEENRASSTLKVWLRHAPLVFALRLRPLQRNYVGKRNAQLSWAHLCMVARIPASLRGIDTPAVVSIVSRDRRFP